MKDQEKKEIHKKEIKKKEEKAVIIEDLKQKSKWKIF